MINVTLKYGDQGYVEVINDGVHAAVGVVTDALLDPDEKATEIVIDPNYKMPDKEHDARDR